MNPHPIITWTPPTYPPPEPVSFDGRLQALHRSLVRGVWTAIIRPPQGPDRRIFTDRNSSPNLDSLQPGRGHVTVTFHPNGNVSIVAFNAAATQAAP